MAKKFERKAAAARAKAPAADDPLAVLHPEREVFIAGRVITVREYGFVEGLKLQAMAKPFFDALYAHASRESHAPTFTEIEQMFVEHSGVVIQLVARAANVEPEWIDTLSDEDGYRLMQEWWLANAGFFTRRVVQRLATEGAVARLQAGRASTTRSSEPATGGAPPTSAG